MESTAATNSLGLSTEAKYPWPQVNVQQPHESPQFPANEENVHQPVPVPVFTTQTFPVQNEQENRQTVVLIQPQAEDTNNVDSCLTLSIISCLCCFIPTGIAAIVMSCLAESSMESGDYQQAKIFSKWAKCLGVASVAIGVTLILIFVSTTFL